MAKVYVIGGCNMDIIAKSNNEIVHHDSNIGEITFNPGGVGRNIAENLFYLEQEVIFVTCFGSDHESYLLKSNCENLGFDLTYSKTIEGASCSKYLAVMNDNGEMYVGVSQMDIMKNINKDDIDNLAKVINVDDYVFLDTNLSPELLSYSLDNIKGIKVLDAISVNKVEKILPLLDKIDILKLNKMEAERICGMELDDDVKIVALLKILMDKGCGEIIISTSDGVYIGYNNCIYRYIHDSLNKKIKNVNGAGDALLSSYIYARSNDGSIESSAIMGIVSALLTTRNEKSVARVTKNDIRKELNHVKITGGIIYD